jgi:hypothetical protein
MPRRGEELAVTMYDPDAPTGSGWWHWVAVNIPASASGLPSGSAPGRQDAWGAMMTNDAGQPAYLRLSTARAMVGFVSNMNSLARPPSHCEQDADMKRDDADRSA